LGKRFKVQGSRFGGKKVQSSRFEGKKGSKFEVRGSKFKVRGSRLRKWKSLRRKN
jgi:hypothetical protein